jgi:post-segregation antitoxin (ccd killing protein)
MSPKRMTTIRVDEDSLRKAHDLGLNVSKIAENALKEAIKKLEGLTPQTASANCRSDLVRGVGFEPTKAYATGS